MEFWIEDHIDGKCGLEYKFYGKIFLKLK